MQRKLNVSDEKIVDLKMRIEELKLEMDKERLKFTLAFISSLVAFIVTSNYIIDSIKSTLINLWKIFVGTLPKILPETLSLIIVLLVLTALPFVAGKIAEILTNRFFKAYENANKKIYGDRIKEIEMIINDCQK